MPNNQITKIVLIMLTAAPLIFCSVLANADEAAPENAMEPAEKVADTATQSAPAEAAEKAADAKEPETKEPEPPWDLSYTLNFVSDYRARGISQTFFEPAVQASIDLTHESGFYTGVWASNISGASVASGASMEIDAYVGFGNDIKAVEGLSYTTGLYGYFFPNGSYSKFPGLTESLNNQGRGKSNESFNTFELMGGLTYKWLTARAWVTLNDFYGQNRGTGWSRGTKGSTYFELAADVPLPFWGLNLIAGIGRTDVKGKLNDDPAFVEVNGDVEDLTLDYTDYRLGLSKTFSVKDAAEFTTSITYITTSNNGDNGYFGKNGYGGSPYTDDAAAANIGRETFVFSVGINF